MIWKVTSSSMYLVCKGQRSKKLNIIWTSKNWQSLLQLGLLICGQSSQCLVCCGRENTNRDLLGSFPWHFSQVFFSILARYLQAFLDSELNNMLTALMETHIPGWPWIWKSSRNIKRTTKNCINQNNQKVKSNQHYKWQTCAKLPFLVRSQALTCLAWT